MKCGRETTFPHIVRIIHARLHNLPLAGTRLTAGIETNNRAKGSVKILSGEHSKTNKSQIESNLQDFRSFNKDDLYDLIKLISQPEKHCVLIFDEFDKVTDDRTIEQISELVKHCSDSWKDDHITIVTCGIQTNTVRNLLTHLSVHRCAKEIFLRPLDELALREIIRNPQNPANAPKFPSFIEGDIVRNAIGFPYYVHLISDKCCELWIDSGQSGEISLDIYEQAKSEVVEETYRSMFRSITMIKNYKSSLEMKILSFLSDRKSSTLSTSNIIQSIHKETNTSKDDIRFALWSLIKDHEILWHSQQDNQIGFRMPLIKPFIRSTISPRLVQPNPNSQSRLDF
jgi:hypothetical protein